MRIAVIDSGIAAGHPHVGDVAGGIALVGDDPADIADRLGHGTAVAAAIREKAPQALLIAVRVLDRQLATSARILAQAISWAAGNGARLINLSLGTTNPAHTPLFEAALLVAAEHGALVVSARGEGELPWFPGSLRGVIGVTADDASPRLSLGVTEGPLGRTIVTSPFPRPIPGVANERNLSGVSFAVANATGLLAHALHREPDLRTADDVWEWIASKAVLAGVHSLILPEQAAGTSE
ncbi:MAG: S8 family serine peptidase [Gemmatimonadaceae bacterium]